MRLVAAVAISAFACSRDAPLASCDDPLGGVYRVGNEEWMVIDNRPAGKPRTLEAFPLFPDAPPTTDLEVAPRVIDLDAELSGFVRRRYQRGVDGCMSKVPARITSCAGSTIEIVLGDPTPPTSFSPCAYGRTDSSRRERWSR